MSLGSHTAESAHQQSGSRPVLCKHLERNDQSDRFGWSGILVSDRTLLFFSKKQLETIA